MRCMWCGRDVIPESVILGYVCPKCGQSMDSQVRQARRWTEIEARLQKARDGNRGVKE